MTEIKKQLILTAVDNNDTFWYDLLLPYLISLKETDYTGDVGVISYGLSEEKIKVLKEHNCLIFEGVRRYSEIIFDRFLSMGEIAKNTQYDALAIIDSDIWFPQKHFSLFEQLKEQDKLYCAYDAWRCTFLVNCIEPDYKQVINEQMSVIENKYGRVWQAGVCMASRQAWLDYYQYLEEKLQQTHIFRVEYGLDATLVNLYSAEKDKVAHLPTKYNCPPVWGIECKGQPWGVEHYFNNEAVEALHVTRNHRQDALFAYHKLRLNHYIIEGAKYNIKPIYSIIPSTVTTPYMNSYRNDDVPTWLFSYASAPHFAIDFDANKQGMIISSAGRNRMVLKNQAKHTQRLKFHFEPILNLELCQNVFVRLNGTALPLSPNRVYEFDVDSEQEIDLYTKELHHGRHIRWFFYDAKFISE